MKNIVEEIEKSRKNLLLKSFSFFYLAFVGIVIFNGFLTLFISLIYKFNPQLFFAISLPGTFILPCIPIYLYQEGKIDMESYGLAEYYLVFCCPFSVMLIFVFLISKFAMIKELNLIFTEYVKRKIVSNINDPVFKIDNYFSSINWFYKLYRNIFPKANRIITEQCFLIDYKGKKIKVAQVDIRKEIGIGKRAFYFQIFKGYFVQVPIEIANIQGSYPFLHFENHYIFMIQDYYHPGLNLVNVTFPIYNRVDLYNLDRFYKGTLAVLRIVSDLIN
ncbi:MAG: hypothetical protein RMJ51_03725 [Candidatus Calescibacterium sp.]|nr:hypothetical protein [Candidatus Calescibacterium sp.]MCX7971728.1 hypothetical protein [bacterium]MDW8195334.1 hypothetical protein [Candidatus Calescibacterium sp.]